MNFSLILILKNGYLEAISWYIHPRLEQDCPKGLPRWVEIMNRLRQRKGHFMPAELLKSQFETLEVPQKAINVSINMPPEKIVNRILELIKY